MGFLGLGNMGLPMALNLLKSGHRLVVFDPVTSAVEAAVEAGAERAGSPADVAGRVRTLVTMLPSGKSVLECYEDVFRCSLSPQIARLPFTPSHPRPLPLLLLPSTAPLPRAASSLTPAPWSRVWRCRSGLGPASSGSASSMRQCPGVNLTTTRGRGSEEMLEL